MRRFLVCLAGLALAFPAEASFMELFARGSASKNYISSTSYTISVSGATGVALTIIPRIRLEGRYTNVSSLQNVLTINSGGVNGTLNDILTQTSIYSVGLDFDLLGPRAAFQPFIYLGAGYVVTERSYYFVNGAGTSSTLIREPTQNNISANAGVGFRIRVDNAFALEVEVFGYGLDIHKPNPIINLSGTAGIRLFL